jgi:glycosyltransferase involved in cell wall biosynthesis
LVAIRRKVPVVVHTFHGTVFSGHFREPLGTAIALWERTLGRYSDAVLTVSPTVAADVGRRGIASGRVRVVPLGLDLERFAAVPPLEGPPPDVVTLVARLAPVKDVPLFVAAVEQVRRERPGLEVRVAGDGPLRRDLEAAAPPWVRFLGNVSDLPGLLATTGAVALSSHSEGSPAKPERSTTR